MSEKHGEDGAESPRVNRRSILKGIGTTAAIGVTGVGLSAPAAAEDEPTVTREEVSVSQAEVQEVLDRKETVVTLRNASVDSFEWDDATGYEIQVEVDRDIHKFQEVAAKSNDGESLFSYVMGGDSPNSATVKADTGTIYRTWVSDGELQTEELELGSEATTEALRILDNNETLSEIESRVSTVKTEKASGYVDRASGTTHLYLPAEMDGEEVWLYAEMSASNGSDDVYVIQRSAINCFIDCVLAQGVSIGTICFNTLCLPCRATPTPPTCAPCAACAGGIGASCAIGCGAEFLL